LVESHTQTVHQTLINKKHAKMDGYYQLILITNRPGKVGAYVWLKFVKGDFFIQDNTIISHHITNRLLPQGAQIHSQA